MAANEQSDCIFPVPEEMLLWQLMCGQIGEICTSHLHSLHWHSKTDLNIAVLILED